MPALRQSSRTDVEPGHPKPSILMLGNFLSARGRNRTVAENLADRLEARCYRVFRSSFRQGRLARAVDRLGSILRLAGQYDVAHVDLFSGPAFLWAEAACYTLAALCKPYVVTLHGGGLPGFALRHPRRVGRLLRRAKTVVAPSQYMAHQMTAYCDNIVVIPNAIEVSAYAFRTRSPAGPRAVWLRAFHRTYNPVLAVRVAGLLERQGCPIEIRMLGPDAGDGSLAESQRLARQGGLAQAVAFSGPVAHADVPSQLAQADLFLNTSRIDNTPVSVVEAMATGLCVVSTNVGGIPYLLEEGRDALLVADDDASAMAEAIQAILENPVLAAHLSRNARSKAERFDWSAVLPRWEEIYAKARGAVPRGQNR